MATGLPVCVCVCACVCVCVCVCVGVCTVPYMCVDVATTLHNNTIDYTHLADTIAIKTAAVSQYTTTQCSTLCAANIIIPMGWWTPK